MISYKSTEVLAPLTFLGIWGKWDSWKESRLSLVGLEKARAEAREP